MSPQATEVVQEATLTGDATRAQPGDNVAKLWEHFDKKAEKHISDLVDNLKGQLDNLLVFAGLFSAINTAFLIYTLPTLSASPQTQTNALLYLLVQGLNNSTLSAQGDAAATNPSTPTSMVRVNALFTASLTCSLLASLGAVVGKQWLMYYSHSVYSSPEERRRELQRKIMGADRYYLRGILEGGLSTALLVALLLFTVGLVIFLQTINQTIALTNTAITAVGLAALLLSLLIALWDDSCPYQSPLTMSLIPDFVRFMMWLMSVTFWIWPVLAAGVLNLTVAGWLAVRGRFPVAQARLLGMWCFFGHFFGIPGLISRVAAGTFEKTAQSLKRDIEDYELYAASMTWLVVHTRDKAEFNNIVEAVPVINEREQLNLFAHSHAINRFFQSEQAKGTTHPQLAPFIIPAAHVYVATLDVASAWFVTMAKRLLRYQTVVDRSEESVESDGNPGSKLPVPVPLYIAAALRSILDHRIYFKWRRNPRYRDREMDKREADLRPILTSCANPSATPRVVSMIALALKLTTERKSNPIPPLREARRIQKADYKAVWSSYMNDEPFVKNLAGGILVYAEHRKTPPENAVWPSDSQFINLLLASHACIETEASAKQLELDGLDLIRGCANLLGSLTGPDEQASDGNIIKAARKLIDITIERTVTLGGLSKEILTTEVEMLNALGQLYHDHRYASILDSFYCLLEHCRSHLIDRPGEPSCKASRQSSHVIAATGRVLEALDPEEVGSSAFVNKVINLIEGIVDKTLVDWEDEGGSTTWASNLTMLAMVQYIKHLSDRGNVEENQKKFATDYVATVDNPCWAGLSEERTRKELREAVGRLKELVYPKKASVPGGDAEIMPPTELAYLE